MFARCHCGFAAPLASPLVSAVHGRTTRHDWFVVSKKLGIKNDTHKHRSACVTIYGAARHGLLSGNYLFELLTSNRKTSLLTSTQRRGPVYRYRYRCIGCKANFFKLKNALFEEMKITICFVAERYLLSIPDTQYTVSIHQRLGPRELARFCKRWCWGQACSFKKVLGRQPTLSSPVPGQLEALCQQKDCHLAHDESMNHERDFETFIPVQKKKKKKKTQCCLENHAPCFFFHIHCVKFLLLFDKKVSHL